MSTGNLRDLFEIYRRVSKHFFRVFFRYGIIGNIVRIDGSSICQLRCPACPQGEGEMGIVGKGYLRFEDFRRFVNKHHYIKNIELANWGELFLNPELSNIITYADKMNVNLTATNGVNLNTVSEEVIEELCRYKFKAMTVSIDGTTNDTYQIYRKGGDFDKVIENIKKINSYKKKYNTDYPKLTWQFIIFGHNEHELPMARKMAQELNMRFKTKLNWKASYSPVKDERLAEKEAGAASPEKYEQKFKNIYQLPCYQLWFSPQINWDGKLLGCCINRWGDFGNVFESNLKSCVKNEKYIYVKKMLLGQKEVRKDTPCFDCHYYKKLQSRKSRFPHLKLLGSLFYYLKKRFRAQFTSFNMYSPEYTPDIS